MVNQGPSILIVFLKIKFYKFINKPVWFLVVIATFYEAIIFL